MKRFIYVLACCTLALSTGSNAFASNYDHDRGLYGQLLYNGTESRSSERLFPRTHIYSSGNTVSHSSNQGSYANPVPSREYLAPAHTTPIYYEEDCTDARFLASYDIIRYNSSCYGYKLHRGILRQEAAAIVAKVARQCGQIDHVQEGSYACRGIFADVGRNFPNNWACGPIETLAQYGFVSSSNHYFRPEREISKAEILAMLMEAGGLAFDDYTYNASHYAGVTPWQMPVMERAYSDQIIASRDFRPNMSATRAQVFDIAAKILKHCGVDHGDFYQDDHYDDHHEDTVIIEENTYVEENNYFINRHHPYRNYHRYNHYECGVGKEFDGYECRSCHNKPDNARYIERNSCDWECRSGYIKNGYRCEREYVSCDIGEYRHGNDCRTCTNKPAHAEYINPNSCEWRCDSGYTQSGGSCIPQQCTNGATDYPNCTSCPSGKVYENGQCVHQTTCGTKPANADWKWGHGSYQPNCQWECRDGYYRSGYTCLPNPTECPTLPAHASWVAGHGQYEPNCDFTCYSGYEKVGNSCQPIQTHCPSLPAHASWVAGHGNYQPNCDFTCYSGYQKQGWQCVPQTCSNGATNPPHCNICPHGRSLHNGQCITNQYYWHTSPWGSCSKSCGGGMQDRTVVCKDYHGSIVSDHLCTAPKPASWQSCNTHDCNNGSRFDWHVRDWSSCDSDCNGHQTRDVLCKRDGWLVVDDNNCLDPKPETTRTCNTNTPACHSCDNGATNYPSCNQCPHGKTFYNGQCVTNQYHWYTGSWGGCNKSCGGGMQDRTVVCKDYHGNVVSDHLCTSPKPEYWRACNTHACNNNPTEVSRTCITSSNADATDRNQPNYYLGKFRILFSDNTRQYNATCGALKPNSIGFTCSGSCTPICRSGYIRTGIGPNAQCIPQPNCSQHTVSCVTTREGQRCETNSCPVGCRAIKRNLDDCYNGLRHDGNPRTVEGSNTCGGRQTLRVRCEND